MAENNHKEEEKVISEATEVTETKPADTEIQEEKSVSSTTSEVKPEADNDNEQIFALVIEDDPDAAFIYKKAMLDNGYKVTHIAHGGDAQEALNTLRPNVILLDMHLPEVNGISLLRQIRGTEDMKDTPVILTTADHSLASTVENEVNLVLLKPVTYSQVKNLVSRIVRNKVQTN